jgi:membrane-bound lytic murein transglycosylase D
MEGLAPLEEASPDIFAWEYLGLQGTERGQKPSAVISAIFPSLGHQKVEETIGFFQTRGDVFFSRALGRSQAYEDMMKKILREKNLPEELFYLALIESGYNPHAFSRAKASGIWQFVTKTARRYGLKVDKWVDERRDPEKSTYAAAEYLKSLYGMFNNWDLAAAGYNAGEGKVLKAMKRAKSQDFWEISRYRYLRKETKQYVPMFLAAVTIASEPQKYGFSNIDYHPPLLYEKMMVPPGTRLDLIARAAETDLSEIKALNPALKKEKVPPNCSQFEIKVPPGKKEVFEKNFQLLSQKSASKGKKHSVRAGETLSGIAKKYRVPLQDLCQVNGLSPQARIKPGLILSVPQ